MIRANLVHTSLIKLLGRRIIQSTPIKRGFVNISNYYKNGNYENARFELHRLELFEKQFKRIKEKNLKSFNSFLNWLKRISKPDDFFGFRFEVATTSLLLKKNCKSFSKQESPDFVIFEEPPKSFIECTTLHVTSSKDIDLKSKIQTKFEEKNEKPYANRHTALFIDITNLAHNRLHILKKPFSNEEIDKFALPLLDRSKFGNLCLFLYILNRNNGKFGSWFYRFDHKHIEQSLKKFLDKYFPHNPQDVSASIPPRI